MNDLEKKEAKKFAKVLRAARKMRGIGQNELGDTLGVSQSLLSKIEHATIVPSAPIWYAACRALEIESFCGDLGYIDTEKNVDLKASSNIGTFKIPERYSHLRGSAVRTSRPLLQYFLNCFGEKKTREFLKSKKLDPDFFVILDGALNINFNLDLIRTLIESGNLKKSDLSKVSALMNESFMNGSMIQNSTSAKGILTTLKNNVLKYDRNWNYEFDLSGKQSFEITCTPAEHLEEFDLESNSVGDFIHEYRKNLFKEFLLIGNIKSKITAESTKVGSLHRCAYQIQA